MCILANVWSYAGESYFVTCSFPFSHIVEIVSVSCLAREFSILLIVEKKMNGSNEWNVKVVKMESLTESKKPIGKIRRFTELVVAGHG